MQGVASDGKSHGAVVREGVGSFFLEQVRLFCGVKKCSHTCCTVCHPQRVENWTLRGGGV